MSPFESVVTVSVIAAHASACGGTAGLADATSDAEPDAATAPVDIPWLDEGTPPLAGPALTPCPMGWRAVTSATGLGTCDPYPADGHLECPDGQVHFPGEPGCTSVGSPCPAGEFAADLPSDRRVIYVRTGATGGDGTPAFPYGSVAEFSIGGLPAGAVIALSRGSHEGPVTLVRGVMLRGPCAEAAVFATSTPSSTQSVVAVRSAGGGVVDLTVGASPRGGVWALGADDATLDGVVVDGAEWVSVASFEGARLTARSVVVRNTRSRSSDGALGRAFEVQDGGSLDASRAVIERNREVAVHAYGDGTAVGLSDAVVRDTESETRSGSFGRGLAIEAGAVAALLRTLVQSSRDVGVFADGDGSMLTSSDLVVRDMRAEESTGTGGRGLSAQAGATVDASRTALQRNRESAVFIDGAASAVRLVDSVVCDTRSQRSDGTVGRGVTVRRGGAIDLRRVAVGRNRDVGVHAHGPGSTVAMRDVVVHDTDSAVAVRAFGRGVNVQLGATAQLEGVVVERNRDIGLFVGGVDTAATLTDVVARDTESREVTGLGGRGLSVQSGAAVQVARAVLERNRELGVFVDGDVPLRVTFTDVVVRETRARACAESSCLEGPAGHGVGSYGAAALSISRFAVMDAHACGFHVARGGQLDLSDGEVRGCPIGVCLQVDGYDVTRLTTGVRFADNGNNLQATSLPLPEPSESALDSP